jgi:hypothetical protein
MGFFNQKGVNRMTELLTPTQAEVTEENRLRSHVQQIVHNIEHGFPDEIGEDDQPFSAFDYLQDALDIEYVVSSKKEYLGARVLVAFGGPNIWINTRTKQVEGYWWGDKCILSYDDDALGLDDALSELFNC